MNPKPSQISGFLLTVALLFGMPVLAQAQESCMGRVSQAISTREEVTTTIELGNLQVEDVVKVEVIRLTGDLRPYVGLLNKTFLTTEGLRTERYAIRFEATSDDRIFTPDPYPIEAEAGSGEYILIIAYEQESGQVTSGDFIINIEITRDGAPLRIPPQANCISDSIQLDSAFGDPVILIRAGEDRRYTGQINDTVNVVYYLVQLPDRQAVKIVMTPKDGDLIPYIGLSPADHLAFSRTIPLQEGESTVLIYQPEDLPEASDNYYIIAATREDFDQGSTSGEFELQVISLAGE